MKINLNVKVYTLACLTHMLLMGCTYNPLAANNHTTGSAASALIGAGIGGGSMALVGGSKTLMVLGGIGGGALGYYVSTLRYDAGGVLQAGGKVYQIGEYIGIYLPADKLFFPNTAEFYPFAKEPLESVAAILSRYPTHNILISGNTSDFGRARREIALSQARAKEVAAYLWSQGINQFQDGSRKLTYVGHGDYLPISHQRTNIAYRSNSNIQIISYPTEAELYRTERGTHYFGTTFKN